MEEGLTREGGLGVSGFGEELGRLVCRRGGREGERRARVGGCGLESSWRVRVTSSDEKVTRLLKGWGVLRGHRTYACGMGEDCCCGCCCRVVMLSR